MSRLVLSAAVLTLGLLCTPVWADSSSAIRRVALVIGNSAYQHAPLLPNPVKDGQATAAMFQKAGFDVVSTQYDVANLQFKRAIRRFMDEAANADIAVVYYAGHGIEIHGTNYLVPVDATLGSDRDADDEAVPLDRLVSSVEGARRLRLIILDACRDNPFTRSMKQEQTALRGVNPGLGAVEPNGIDTLIAYAAKAGSEAADGNGDHSPFTTALLDNLFVPGLDIRLAFGRVRDEVLKQTNKRQEPFVYGSLGGSNISLVPAPDQNAAAAQADAGESTDYNLVREIGTKGAWEVFLNQHPKGFYSELARQQISKLGSGEPPSTGSVSSPKMTLAALEPPKPPATRAPSTEEQRAWDKIKDSSDPAAFRDFIKQFPTSVLASVAQLHAQAIEVEQKAAAREAAIERADAERQAQLAQAKRQADEAQQKITEQLAALAKAQQEAQAAEAARQQAEADAAQKREEAVRQKQLADAAAAAKLKADQEAAQKKAEQDAALAKAKAQQQEAQAAEAARQKLLADAAAKLKADQEAAQKKAEQDAALAKAKAQQQEAQAAEAARQKQLADAAAAAKLKADQEAAQKIAQQEAAQKKAEQDAALAKAQREAQAAEAARQKQLADPAVAKLKADQEAAQKKAEQDAELAKAKAQQQEAEAAGAARQKQLADAAAAAKLKADQEAAQKKAEQDAELAKAKAQQQEAEAARQKQLADAAVVAKLKADKEAAQKKAEQDAALAKAQQEAQAAEAARQKQLADAAAAAKLKADQEAAQKKAEQDAALAKAQQEAQAAEAARQQAERDAALKREEAARQTALAEAARKQEAICSDEQNRLATLQTAGKKAKGDLAQLAQGLTCERLRPLVTAALQLASAPDANTPDQVRAAQQQLARLGCFSGAVDGALSDETKLAVRSYQAARGKPASGVQIDDALVSELTNQSANVCPLVCSAGTIAQGDRCVAASKPSETQARAKAQKENSADRKQARHEEQKKEANRQQAKHDSAPAPQPRVRQEASSNTGGHASSAVGVGF